MMKNQTLLDETSVVTDGGTILVYGNMSFRDCPLSQFLLKHYYEREIAQLLERRWEILSLITWRKWDKYDPEWAIEVIKQCKGISNRVLEEIITETCFVTDIWLVRLEQLVQIYERYHDVDEKSGAGVIDPDALIKSVCGNIHPAKFLYAFYQLPDGLRKWTLTRPTDVILDILEEYKKEQANQPAACPSSD